MGPNVVGELASGTMTAAVRAVKLQVAPRAIAFSWNAPAKLWYLSHDGVQTINEFIDYPGKTAAQLVERAIKENFWDCPLLNINFPTEIAETVRFTKFLPYFADYYSPVKLNPQGENYHYPLDPKGETPPQLEYDAYAMNAGYISITPCQLDLLNEASYKNLKNSSFSLPSSRP
jgi:broad specificity polyphosphatase/5'/3'-nucleotidase SurE